MTRRILLFLLILSPFIALAQAPGYMGKKLTVIYNDHFSPVLLKGNTNYRGNQGLKAFNAAHSLGIDYVRTKDRSIGLSIEYMRTAAELDNINNAHTYPEYYYTIQNGDTIISDVDERYISGGEFTGNIQVSSTTVSLYWKFFGKKFLAPWGVYQRFDFGMQTFRVKKNNLASVSYVAVDSYYNWNNGNTSIVRRPGVITPEEDDNTYKGFRFSYSIGKQRIYYDKIVVDAGFRLGLMFSAEGFKDEPYKSMMKERLNKANWFGLNIGIGYLAY